MKERILAFVLVFAISISNSTITYVAEATTNYLDKKITKEEKKTPQYKKNMADIDNKEDMSKKLIHNVVDKYSTKTAASVSDGKFTYDILNGTYCALTGYTGDETEITVPSELGGYILQKISSNAFANNTVLEKITLPETLTTIDYRVFSGCTSLMEIKIPESVTVISGDAFRNCTKLSSVMLPSGWETTGGGGYTYSPFRGCTKLTEISLPEGMTKLPAYAFYGCTALKQVNFNGNLEEIGNNAFNGCTLLKQVNFNEGLELIGDYAFSGCKALKQISFNERLEEIGSSAFSGCIKLPSVALPDTVVKIGNYAFSGCTLLEMAEIISKEINVGSNAFENCPDLLIYTVDSSNVVKYSIDNDINFIIIKSNKEDSTEGALIVKESFYDISEQSIINNVVKMELEYSIRDFDKIKNPLVDIIIPKMSELYINDIKLDNEIISTYTYDKLSQKLSIPINAEKGKIQFSVRMTSIVPITKLCQLRIYYWR